MSTKTTENLSSSTSAKGNEVSRFTASVGNQIDETFGESDSGSQKSLFVSRSVEIIHVETGFNEEAFEETWPVVCFIKVYGERLGTRRASVKRRFGTRIERESL